MVLHNIHHRSLVAHLYTSRPLGESPNNAAECTERFHTFSRSVCWTGIEFCPRSATTCLSCVSANDKVRDASWRRKKESQKEGEERAEAVSTSASLARWDQVPNCCVSKLHTAAGYWSTRACQPIRFKHNSRLVKERNADWKFLFPRLKSM